MRRVDQLIAATCAALHEEEAAARSRLMVLRKAGLFTRGRPGRPMPEPTPSDVTNALLSFLAGSAVTEVAAAVGIVRNSRNTGCPIAGLQPRQFPVAGLKKMADDTLGAALDTLLAHLAAGGDLFVEEAAWAGYADDMRWTSGERKRILKDSRRIHQIELSVRRLWWGWRSYLSFATDAITRSFSVIYHGVLPEHVDLVEERDDGRMLQKLRSRNTVQPDRVTSNRVGYPTLAALAACLRGDAGAVAEALKWRADTHMTWLAEPGAYVDMHGGLITVVQRSPAEQARPSRENNKFASKRRGR